MKRTVFLSLLACSLTGCITDGLGEILKGSEPPVMNTPCGIQGSICLSVSGKDYPIAKVMHRVSHKRDGDDVLVIKGDIDPLPFSGTFKVDDAEKDTTPSALISSVDKSPSVVAKPITSALPVAAPEVNKVASTVSLGDKVIQPVVLTKPVETSVAAIDLSAGNGVPNDILTKIKACVLKGGKVNITGLSAYSDEGTRIKRASFQSSRIASMLIAKGVPAEGINEIHHTDYAVADHINGTRFELVERK